MFKGLLFCEFLYCLETLSFRIWQILPFSFLICELRCLV